MYEKIKITENTLQILSVFTNDFNSEYYVREVQRLLRISPRTAQLILEDLENKGVLESKLRGKIKNYRINISKFTKRYLVFVEEYKTIAFLKNNLLIKELIEKLIPYIKGIGIIFGSYVKGLEKSDSDLDIFVIGRYDMERVEKISKILDIEISVKCYPKITFKRILDDDILVKEVLKNHVVFKDVEKFIDLVFKNG